ncbi:uncharacterized protein TNCV_4479841 [Trichonephila clavipes]|nr:uncharacterized protein TNCV_4479841 [Trichonephila clavipes]
MEASVQALGPLEPWAPAMRGFTHPVQWLATLTAVPLGLGSNPGEDMDVCKRIVLSRHGGTLNSRRASSPFGSYCTCSGLLRALCLDIASCTPEPSYEIPAEHWERGTYAMASWCSGAGQSPALLLPGKIREHPVATVAEWYRYRTVACLVTSSSPVPLKTRRVGQRCTLNLSRAGTSSRWCGVVVRRGRCQLRCRPRHLAMVQNYVFRRQKPSSS